MTPAPRDALILAAAGSAERFGGDKLTRPLAGLPVFAHALRTLAPLFPPERRFLAVAPERLDDFRQLLRQLPEDCSAVLVPGGPTRFDSIRNALRALPTDTDLVAIHDAARPLVTRDAAAQCLNQARLHGAALLAHRATDTIKVASPADGNATVVSHTPDRRTLWAAETPQAARYDLLVQAFAAVQSHDLVPTDDAQALELIGLHPVIVENTTPNLKITYPEDLLLAAALLDPPSPIL